MALYNAEPGLGHVTEYASSGIPVAGTITAGQTATFTKVTRAITFNASGSTTHLGLAQTGRASISFDGGVTSYVFGNRNDSDASASNRHRVVVKCVSIENTGTLDIPFIAELTTIDAGQCPTWTFADYCTVTG